MRAMIPNAGDKLVPVDVADAAAMQKVFFHDCSTFPLSVSHMIDMWGMCHTLQNARNLF